MTAALPLEAQDAPFLIDLDRFQGPLDLLLHLIRHQDIDIFDIPIARITDQFLAAVREIEAGQLDSAGEFLELAATLIRIKVQMLLPRREGEEDEDPRIELVRRLLEYELIREIASRLEQAEGERSRRSRKGWIQPRQIPALTDTPLETTWDEVFSAALNVVMPERPDLMHRVTTRPVAMDDKIILILEALARGTRVRFSDLVDPLADKMHGVMTFLASLELGRRREILLRQAEHFAELWMYNPDGTEDGPQYSEDPGDEAE